jgi:ring-1,2-phenylacetyl-CoA epoxidase subunit PaaE
MGLFGRKKKDGKSKHTVSLTVAEINAVTKESISIGFKIPDDLKSEFSFIAGQYITVIAQINGAEIRRSYSICSAEDDKILKIGVKKVKNGLMSNYLPDQVKVGDALEVMKPTGNFKLDNASGNFVSIAAGSGITPVMSQILKTAKSGGTYKLYYGNNTVDSSMFKADIDALISDKINATYYYTEQGDSQFTKEVIRELIKSDLDLLKADGFYICGPSQVIENAREVLKEFGVPDEKVHFELFVAVPAVKKTKPEKAGKGITKAKIILDGEEISLDLDRKGDSVLDQVLDAGYDAPYSCKGAVCCTCKAKVKEGSVSLDANFSLSDSELEEGYILTCQSHPTSDSIVIDMDQG